MVLLSFFVCFMFSFLFWNVDCLFCFLFVLFIFLRFEMLILLSFLFALLCLVFCLEMLILLSFLFLCFEMLILLSFCFCLVFCFEMLILLSIFVLSFESNNLLIDLYFIFYFYFIFILYFNSVRFMYFNFLIYSQSKHRKVTCETAPELRDKSVNVGWQPPSISLSIINLKCFHLAGLADRDAGAGGDGNEVQPESSHPQEELHPL